VNVVVKVAVLPCDDPRPYLYKAGVSPLLITASALRCGKIAIQWYKLTYSMIRGLTDDIDDSRSIQSILILRSRSDNTVCVN
jgi:hypothetical protein